jgi:pseudaminic acid cytidylyltransferase
MTKTLAVIPARGGSKRIPKKNIKHFCGKPLIAYSIDAAQRSNLFDHIVVSTDDEEIKNIALEYGAEVPFFRPIELSDDFAGTDAVTNHAVDFFLSKGIKMDLVCTIYATAPLLEETFLISSYKKLLKSDAVNCFSATSMPFPIQRTFKLKNERCQMFWPEYANTRSQDLEEAFQDAGQFYWKKVGKSSSEPLFGADSIVELLPRHLVQDIDTMEDWKHAEVLYKVVKQLGASK